jgi:hypothetical protein
MKKEKLKSKRLQMKKKRKEENEKLEEDLVKAKRRKLGNIFFIGELFKLQMLTDTIMYDCIEYLLRIKMMKKVLNVSVVFYVLLEKNLILKLVKKLQINKIWKNIIGN